MKQPSRIRRLLPTALTALLLGITLSCGSGTPPPDPAAALNTPTPDPTMEADIQARVEQEVQAQLELMEQLAEPDPSEDTSANAMPTEEPTATPIPDTPTPEPTATATPFPTPPIPPGQETRIQTWACEALEPEDAKSPLACQSISYPDLARIRQLSVRRSFLASHHFDGMLNLEYLSVHALQQPIQPGSLVNLPNLTRLDLKTNLTREPTYDRQEYLLIPTGSFLGLDKLQTLRITAQDNWSDLIVENNTLEGLPALETLQLSYLQQIDPKALERTPRIKNVYLFRPGEPGQPDPEIPTHLFAALPELESVRLKGYRWPLILTLNNHRTACNARSWTAESMGNPDLPPQPPFRVKLIGQEDATIDLETIGNCPEPADTEDNTS